VVVVPRRPGARPSVACYSRDDPGADPAIECVRRTVLLDATAAAHYDVAAALAVAGGDGTDEAERSFDDLLEDEAADGERATEDPDSTRTTADTRMTDGGRSPGGAEASVSAPAAELAARRESVDAATHRVLDGAPETAAPLAFCGLAGVVEPVADASP
jgi:hypothetical protein